MFKYSWAKEEDCRLWDGRGFYPKRWGGPWAVSSYNRGSLSLENEYIVIWGLDWEELTWDKRLKMFSSRGATFAREWDGRGCMRLDGHTKKLYCGSKNVFFAAFAECCFYAAWKTHDAKRKAELLHDARSHIQEAIGYNYVWANSQLLENIDTTIRQLHATESQCKQENNAVNWFHSAVHSKPSADQLSMSNMYITPSHSPDVSSESGFRKFSAEKSNNLGINLKTITTSLLVLIVIFVVTRLWKRWNTNTSSLWGPSSDRSRILFAAPEKENTDAVLQGNPMQNQSPLDVSENTWK